MGARPKKQQAMSVQEIATAAAKEALRLQKVEERQRVRKNRYHNTELLLKNYLRLVEHRDHAKDRASDILNLEEIEELEEIGVDDIIIQSIMRSRVRTAVMINQIETCLEILKTRQETKGQGEKYEVVWCLYMDPARNDLEWGELIRTVAEELNCGESSVYRWKNEMVRELSIMLFGVDGLQLEI